MLEYIRGKLVEASPSKAIVDVQGLGYGLCIPLSVYSKLPQTGCEIIFYVSTVIREDSHKLYGFLTSNDRDLFEKLNDISGVGPKTSLALLGHMDANDLQLAITTANHTLLSKIPGIGKKTAERLVVEMRGKFKIQEKTTTSSPRPISAASDAIQALIHLGYNPLNAQKAVSHALKTADEEIPLSQLITIALRLI
ncbi:MAG: Holliday junction branch migration protein RuvA [Chlamydiota bacterium]